MTRLACVLGTVSLALALPAGALHGQTGIHVAVSPIVPVGELSDYAGAGFMAAAGVHRQIGNNPLLTGHVTAFFGSVAHDDIDGDATQIPGIGVGGRYRFSMGPTRSYGDVIVGGLQHRYVSDMFENESETKLFVSPGGGIEGTLAGLALFADARLILASGTSFFGVFIGLSKRVADQ